MKRGAITSKTFPHLKRVCFLGVEKHRGMYSIPEIMGLTRTVSDADLKARQAAFTCHDVVNIRYTSGTTGFPKGVMLSHYNILNNASSIGQRQRFSNKDKLCIQVPLFHCFGCVLGVLVCLNYGATMVFTEVFNPITTMASIEQEKCTSIYGVPTMFIAILEHPLFPKFDFSSLRTGIMAGSVCPTQTMRQVTEKMYMKGVTSVYGLTECSPGMTQTDITDPLHYRLTGVGRAFPHVEVKAADPETGEEVPRGTVGEMCCRGYNVMQGYYKDPEATAQCIDKDGWLHSGDLGIMDENGYVTITGRIKDMIIRGGENIYPREIEEYLYTMPGIAEVQVVGVPSRKYGEEVGACIILKPGVNVETEDVRDFCRGQIAWHKIPKYVAFVQAFPLTTSGKVQKFKLRELAAKRFPEAMR